MKISWKKIGLIGGILVVVCLIFLAIYYKKPKETFSVDSVLLKSVVKEGESVSNNIKITSYEDNQEFKIEVKGLEGLSASINASNFKLNSEEIKQVKIIFLANISKYSAGVHVGSLIISSDSAAKTIPIIIEIQSKSIFYSINLDVGPEYREIRKGTSASTGIRIFNLKDKKTHVVEMNYYVKNFKGETILPEKENVAIGSEMRITKTINLPADIPEGDYVFVVTATFENSTSTTSYLFSVSNKKTGTFDITSLNVIFPIVVLILLLGVIALVIYVIRDRNELFLELQKQHEREIAELTRRLEEKKIHYLSRAKSRKEKVKIVKVYKIIKEKAVRKIKVKQKKQKIEFVKLKKLNKKDVMKMKLAQWEKQGFDVESLLKEEEKSLKDEIQKWKGQGYDTSILRKQKDI